MWIISTVGILWHQHCKNPARSILYYRKLVCTSMITSTPTPQTCLGLYPQSGAYLILVKFVVNSSFTELFRVLIYIEALEMSSAIERLNLYLSNIALLVALKNHLLTLSAKAHFILLSCILL